MDLLVVRHAVAVARSGARSPARDAERALTAEGRRRFEKGARGLSRLVERVDLVATSPLRRAVETGALLSAACHGARTESLEALSPDAAPEALLAWLRKQPRRAVVAVVGHEPGLSRLVALLLAGRASPFLELRKGGACLLAVPRPPRPGRATLRWLLTGGQLRRLAR
jgi:phosphohistidine phosphatase